MKIGNVMKKCPILLLLPLLAFCGCRQKSAETVEKVQVSTSVKPHVSILHSLPELHVQDSCVSGHNLYVWMIDRVSDSLDIVTDELGDRFADNTIKISVRKNGSSLFARTFRKADFRHLLDKDFVEQSILDGCRFVQVNGGTVTFSMAVSYPESDMSRPFKLDIGSDGSYMIVQDDDMEEEYETDSASAVSS